jgi:hypothetical protein
MRSRVKGVSFGSFQTLQGASGMSGARDAKGQWQPH